MAKKTIKLTKYTDVIREYTAGGSITPGMLIAVNSSGNVVAHASAGGNALAMFALEDELQGGAIEDVYASGAKVQAWIPRRGDVVLGILADEEDVSIGDFLESNGTGYLQKHSADSAGAVEYPACIVAQAMEAKDLLGSSGESSVGTLGYNKRIQILIL